MDGTLQMTDASPLQACPDLTHDFAGAAIMKALDHDLPYGQVAWGVFVGIAPDDPHRLDKLLIEAVRADSPCATKELLDRGANPNWPEEDVDRWTAVHFAAGQGRRSAMRVLIASGKCDYTIPDAKGRYAYELALGNRDRALARLLARKQLQQSAAQARAICGHFTRQGTPLPGWTQAQL